MKMKSYRELLDEFNEQSYNWLSNETWTDKEKILIRAIIALYHKLMLQEEGLDE